VPGVYDQEAAGGQALVDVLGIGERDHAVVAAVDES
jgi:hypothetical protein